MSPNVPKCPEMSPSVQMSRIQRAMQATTEASKNTTVARANANPVEVATEKEPARLPTDYPSLGPLLILQPTCAIRTHAGAGTDMPPQAARISQRCIPAVRRESRQRFPFDPWADAAAPRRATDARSRRSRTLRPLRGGAQPRSRCPVRVSCRWPASRGCAAACPRHSPPRHAPDG
jgi:hypothetical protein